MNTSTFLRLAVCALTISSVAATRVTPIRAETERARLEDPEHGHRLTPHELAEERIAECPAPLRKEAGVFFVQWFTMQAATTNEEAKHIFESLDNIFKKQLLDAELNAEMTKIIKGFPSCTKSPANERRIANHFWTPRMRAHVLENAASGNPYALFTKGIMAHHGFPANPAEETRGTGIDDIIASAYQDNKKLFLPLACLFLDARRENSDPPLPEDVSRGLRCISTKDEYSTALNDISSSSELSADLLDSFLMALEYRKDLELHEGGLGEPRHYLRAFCLCLETSLESALEDLKYRPVISDRMIALGNMLTAITASSAAVALPFLLPSPEDCFPIPDGANITTTYPDPKNTSNLLTRACLTPADGDHYGFALNNANSARTNSLVMAGRTYALPPLAVMGIAGSTMVLAGNMIKASTYGSWYERYLVNYMQWCPLAGDTNTKLEARALALDHILSKMDEVYASFASKPYLTIMLIDVARITSEVVSKVITALKRSPRHMMGSSCTPPMVRLIMPPTPSTPPPTHAASAAAASSRT